MRRIGALYIEAGRRLKGSQAEIAKKAKLIAFSVLPGCEHIYLGRSPPLEDEPGDLWVKGPLVMRGERSVEVICQSVPEYQKMGSFKVNGVLHAEVPQTDGLLTNGRGACSSLCLLM